MELGIYTFGERVADPRTGKVISAPQRMKDMLGIAKLADDAGLDVIGVGEHHSLRFVNSATATILAAMAAVTKRIRLTSASTSISTADPVRTFSGIRHRRPPLVSEGRVEIVFGRGAFTDNFPLFGYSLDDYDALFAEKVSLFAELNAHERVTWSGRFRSSLEDAEIAPRPAQPQLPVWIGAGSATTVMRVARLGYPLAIPVLGGTLSGYAQLASLYHQAWVESGRRQLDARIAVFSHLHVTETARETREDFFPNYSAYLEPLFKGPMPRPRYEQMLSPQGSLVGGSVQETIDKILAQYEALRTVRYLGQIDIGALSFSEVAKGIELYATRVAPVVRKATGTGQG